MARTQKAVVLPPWLSDLIDKDIEMGAGPGIQGRSPLIGVWHAALGLYIEIPREVRVPIARNMRIERASEEAIDKIKSTYWPYALLRAAANLNEEERELFVECLERCPEFFSTLARRYIEVTRAQNLEALELVFGSGSSKTPQGETSRKPRRGR